MQFGSRESLEGYAARMNLEPEYIAQNADGLTGMSAQDWFSAQAKEAKTAGMTHCRFAVHDERGWLLVEGWRIMPRVDGELREGELRWQIAA